MALESPIKKINGFEIECEPTYLKEDITKKRKEPKIAPPKNNRQIEKDNNLQVKNSHISKSLSNDCIEEEYVKKPLSPLRTLVIQERRERSSFPQIKITIPNEKPTLSISKKSQQKLPGSMLSPSQKSGQSTEQNCCDSILESPREIEIEMSSQRVIQSDFNEKAAAKRISIASTRPSLSQGLCGTLDVCPKRDSDLDEELKTSKNHPNQARSLNELPVEAETAHEKLPKIKIKPPVISEESVFTFTTLWGDDLSEIFEDSKIVQHVEYGSVAVGLLSKSISDDFNQVKCLDDQFISQHSVSRGIEFEWCKIEGL